MTTICFNSQEHRLGVDSEALLPLLQSYKAHLNALCHTPRTIINYLLPARHFAAWLGLSGIDPANVDEGVVEKFALHHCHCPCSNHRRSARVSAQTVKYVKYFVLFLAEIGTCAPVKRAEKVITKMTLDFENWLRMQRGVSERTITIYRDAMMILVPALGDDFATYNAARVRQIIFDESRKRSTSYLKIISNTLRHYLRYQAMQGNCQPWLDQAVPSFASWRLSSLPRYLHPTKIERLIASCDLTTPVGIRDYAILLLLTNLGLRGGDIIDMRLDDIERSIRISYASPWFLRVLNGEKPAETMVMHS